MIKKPTFNFLNYLITIILGSLYLVQAYGQDLPTVQPESLGYSSNLLSQAAAYIEQYHSPSGMVLVDGKVILSWGDSTQKLSIHSMRKSLLSALYGIAVNQNTINLSATLASLGIDDTVSPSLTSIEKQATIQDLLEARSGVYHLSVGETPNMQTERPLRGSHAPGSFWYYNNWDFNALGLIYNQLSEGDLFQKFNEQIAKPIGMQDYIPSDGSYISDPSLSSIPQYVFSMSTRDLARFGLLYLQGGAWNGNTVIPQSWINESTTSDSVVSPSAGPGQEGYGYLWWIGVTGTGLFNYADLGSGAFAAEGYGGHYVVIIPAYNMVMVSRANDTWFESDPNNNSIGPNRMGKLLSKIIQAKVVIINH
jgi:CubicO group peptidase (beta-lactamase class C family)